MENEPLDQLWVASWAVDPQGRPTHADPRWRQFTGQSGEQLRDAWLDAIHPDDRSKVGATWKNAFDRRDRFRIEYRLRRFDGVYRWVLAAGAPFLDSDGRFGGYIGSVVDIEARQAMEAALRESEERFRVLVESAAQAVWETGPEGRPTGDNAAWRLYTGQSLETYRAAGWLDAVHPDDRDEADRRWREAVASRTIYQDEYRLKRKDDGWRWSSAHAAPIFAADGSVRKWVGVNIDINARKLAQEALRQSERRMRLAQDAAHAGSWEWDLSDNSNIWSENLWALYGLSRGGCEATYDNWLASVHEEDRARVAGVVAEAAAAGLEMELQWRVNLPEGEKPRWLLSRGRPIFGANGDLERYIGIVFDITEHKNAADALRESERRYRLLHETLRDPFFRMDMDGRLLEFNELYREMLGYSQEELLGLTRDDVTPERWRETEARVLREQILPRGYSDVYEKEYRRKDGSLVPVELRTVLSRDEAGEPKAMWALVRDVSARKQAEARLRDGQQRAHLATQAAEVGIWEWNVDTDEVRWDDQTFHIHGMAPTADNILTFADWADCVLPEEIALQKRLLRRHAQSQGVHVREFRIRRKDDGEVRTIQAIETTRNDENGSIEWVVGTNRDITERKRTEEALREADRRKDEFIATLAHELRNPLAPIHNGVHVLKAAARTRGEESDRPILEMMERQVGHLVRLVDDLLEIARITVGKVELRKERTDVAAVLRSALETSQPAIERGRHQIAMNEAPEALQVDGDPLRLSQAFTNLLNNAAKYTPPGGRIEIDAARQGGEAVVTIRDNGRGIATEALPRVFELFAQAGPAPHDGGLGIGLALVRNLVEMHGGGIEARSGGLGKGSEFVVRLPLFPTQDDPAEETPAAPPPGAVKRALIIDDDHDVADALALLLESLGAAVSVAYGGEAGARKAEAFCPDIVFLDLGMPGQDGFETARRLRTARNGRNVTLVALSGWGQDEDRRRTREAGFDAHLTKPASIDALRALLQA